MIDTTLVPYAIAFIVIAAIASVLALAAIAFVVRESRSPVAPAVPMRRRPLADSIAA